MKRIALFLLIGLSSAALFAGEAVEPEEAVVPEEVIDSGEAVNYVELDADPLVTEVDINIFSEEGRRYHYNFTSLGTGDLAKPEYVEMDGAIA